MSESTIRRRARSQGLALHRHTHPAYGTRYSFSENGVLTAGEFTMTLEEAALFLAEGE